MRKKRFVKPVSRMQEHRTNNRIRAPRVRIAGSHPETGEKLESVILDINDAIKMANDLEVDLVEISPNANPPVCWIVDYNKFLYEQKKRKKAMEQNNQKSETKELRLTPHTDEHDLNFKAKHAQNWLSNGDRVKCSVFFRGRSIVFKEQGQIILLKLATMVEDFGVVESMPKMEGKKMFMNLVPKKK